MLYLFFVVLLCFLLIAYIDGGKSIVSPLFLLLAIISVAYVFMMINKDNWMVNLSDKFVVYILGFILSFAIGTKLANIKVRQKRVALIDAFEEETSYYPAIIMVIVSAGATMLFSYKMISMAYAQVGAFSITGILRQIYNNVVEDVAIGFIFNQMLEISVAVAYISTFRFFVRVYSPNDKTSRLLLLMPIAFFFVTVLISTDRNILIRYFIYFVCLMVLFNYKKQRKVDNIKLIKLLIPFFIVAVLFFFVYGKAKNNQSNLLNTVEIYVGSGLNDFNIWIDTFEGPYYFGKSTFSVMLNAIHSVLGIGSKVEINRIDEFITYVSDNGYIYGSNIYTALKPYIEDFGYFGVIIFPLVIGWVYQKLYNKALENKPNLSWVIYAALIYPVIYVPILEQLFRRFHLGFIYEVVWLCIIYTFTTCIFKKKEAKK